MLIQWIRHGKTLGNEEKRYIGRTDEALSENGKKELESVHFVCEGKLFCSPMIRCLQTLECLCPDRAKSGDYTVVEEFREIDFGVFEGKNYQELNHNPLYQAWIDSGGTMDFPEGEPLGAFKARTLAAFSKLLLENCEEERLCLIVHGGTIMTILEQYEEKHSYYDWQCKNGSGFLTEYKNGKLVVLSSL